MSKAWIVVECDKSQLESELNNLEDIEYMPWQIIPFVDDDSEQVPADTDKRKFRIVAHVKTLKKSHA